MQPDSPQVPPPEPTPPLSTPTDPAPPRPAAPGPASVGPESGPAPVGPDASGSAPVDRDASGPVSVGPSSDLAPAGAASAGPAAPGLVPAGPVPPGPAWFGPSMSGPSGFVPVPQPPPLRLPLIGHSYPEVMRTPRWRWWQPVLAWPVAVVLGVVAMALPMVIYAVAMYAGGDPRASEKLTSVTDPATTAVLDVSLALLIGVALLGTLVGSRVSPRFLHSVEGRVRWGWLLRCVLVLLPVFALYIGGAWLLDGSETTTRPQGWPWLLLFTFVLTPFQAAGEEYFFRGFVITTIGSFFRRPVVGIVVAGVVSCALFAAAHGSPDPWILTDLGVMAAGCCYLAWRTGGLEAGIALHVVNNVVVGVAGILTGTIAESYVDATTTSTPLQALVSVVWTAVVVAILDLLYRRSGVARTVPASVGARP